MLPFCLFRQLGLGIAESLSDLYDKLAVSERQLAGAKSAKGGGKKAAEKSRKVQGLEGQVSGAVSGFCDSGTPILVMHLNLSVPSCCCGARGGNASACTFGR